MITSRLIPCMLLKGEGFYKTIKFQNPNYIGDPINTLRLFNNKEVDEIIILDVTATLEQKAPRVDYVKKLASECFMPLCYGGGVTSIDQVANLFKAGVEKIAINTALFANTTFVTDIIRKYGSQSIVASIDYKEVDKGKYSVFIKAGRKNIQVNPIDYAKKVESLGAGEILLTSIDREGRMSGYDLEMIHNVCSSVSIPVIANGGAGNLADCENAIQSGASAAAAGSIFIYYGPKKAVLINYPENNCLE